MAAQGKHHQFNGNGRERGADENDRILIFLVQSIVVQRIEEKEERGDTNPIEEKLQDVPRRREKIE